MPSSSIPLETAARPLRLVVADDHGLLRQGVVSMLEAEGFDVVGEAGDAADAFVAVRSLAPDVVLLDIRLPDLDGFGVAEVLAGDEDAPAVVLVSSRSRGDYGPRVDASPALGFIAKHDLTGDALRGVLSGSP